MHSSNSTKMPVGSGRSSTASDWPADPDRPSALGRAAAVPDRADCRTLPAPDYANYNPSMAFLAIRGLNPKAADNAENAEQRVHRQNVLPHFLALGAADDHRVTGIELGIGR